MVIDRHRYGGTLEKKIRRYLKKFGITRALCTDSFFYIPTAKTVCFTILRYTTDEELIEHVNQKYDVDIHDWFFIFSLLHEVGHHMTMSQLSEKDFIEEVAARKVISQLIDNDTDKNAVYFELNAEDLANRWAIEYIENHTQECWDFQNRCFKIIEHIYKKPSFRKRYK